MYEKLYSTPTLETERLVLRKFTLDDAEDVFAYAGNPEVARHVSWDAHRTIEDSKGFLRWVLDRYEAGRASDWAITLKESGHAIGSIGMVDVDEKNARCEIGYVIAQPMWGRGLVPEALERVLAFLFEEGGMNRVEAVHVVENEASGRVLTKTGMQFEGLLRQRVQAKGRFWDVRAHALVKQDWSRLQAERELKGSQIVFEPADEEDAAEIQALQKLAFATEAELYDGPIPPMMQTIEELRGSFADHRYLKAVLGGRIIGSVRAKAQDGTCYIGRMVVHPDYRRHGIGTNLLGKIEEAVPESRYELFTGHLSRKTIALYEKNGYVQYQTVRWSDDLTHVYLEKKR